MFKGLGAVNFNYSAGTVSASNGWTYSIRARFDSQLAVQPQYRTLADGWRYVANMAIGLADDDYRAKFGVMPGTNLSEFGQWIDNNRQAVYNDAQGWFVQTGSGTGGGTGTGNQQQGGNEEQQQNDESNPFNWLSENKTMLMVVGGGLLLLMMLRR